MNKFFLLSVALSFLVTGCNINSSQSEAGKRLLDENAIWKPLSNTESGFSSTESPASCSNGAVFTHTISEEGVARVSNKEWLRGNLKRTVLNNPRLIVAKRDCYNQGYSEQKLHSFTNKESVVDGIVSISTSATFSCCDTDNNPATKPKTRGPFHKGADKCSFHLGSNWVDVPELLMSFDLAYDEDETRINYLRNSATAYLEESSFSKSLDGSKARHIAIQYLAKKKLRMKNRCKKHGGQLVVLNHTIWEGTEMVKGDFGTAFENEMNTLARASVMCCSRNNTNPQEEQEAALGTR